MMKIYYTLDEENNVVPCDLIEWGTFLKSKKKIVKQEYVGDKWISTVFIGLGHNWEEDGELHVFETMVFNRKKGQPLGSEIYCERYGTYQAALEGHKRAVEWVKGGCKDE